MRFAPNVVSICRAGSFSERVPTLWREGMVGIERAKLDAVLGHGEEVEVDLGAPIFDSGVVGNALHVVFSHSVYRLLQIECAAYIKIVAAMRQRTVAEKSGTEYVMAAQG